MADEQKITLTYTSGAVELTRDFTVYRCNMESVEFFRQNKRLLNGNIIDWNIGYRRLIDAELKTLGNNKTDLFWLYGFMIGTERRISFDGVGYDVIPVEDEFSFEFLSDVFYANALTLHFRERVLRTITDTGSTRKLVPLYVPSGEGITGPDDQQLSIFVNLCDDSSAEFEKHDFRFVSGNEDDFTAGYRHGKIRIAFGPVLKPEFREWLLEFCLWGNRQIDTTQIDPVNGNVYNVVFDGTQLIWELFENIKGGFITELMFVEKTLRKVTEVEIFPEPSFFIADVDRTDTKPTNY